MAIDLTAYALGFTTTMLFLFIIKNHRRNKFWVKNLTDLKIAHVKEVAQAKADRTRSIIGFARSYAHLLKWNRVWKRAAKKHYQLNKEKSND